MLSLCVSLVPPSSLSLNLSLPSLSLPFLAFLVVVTEQCLFYRATERSLNLQLLLSPLGDPSELFLLL